MIREYKVHYGNAEKSWKNKYEHHIRLEKDVSHLNIPSNRLSEPKKEFVREKVAELLERGLLSSPRQGGTPRLCVQRRGKVSDYVSIFGILMQ